MSVYVDEPIHRFGRMHMCHLVADTLDELHAMADTIGVNRKWFQSKARYPHYDICKSKRALAVKAGAIECDTRKVIEIVRSFKIMKTQVLTKAKCKYCGSEDVKWRSVVLDEQKTRRLMNKSGTVHSCKEMRFGK